MTEKDLAAIIEAEGKRLEAIHKEYMERHQDFMKRYQEFMDLVKQIEREYKPFNKENGVCWQYNMPAAPL